MKTLFRFTEHFRDRYAQRILNEPNRYMVKNLDYFIINDIKDAQEKRDYLNLPRFILHLWENYDGPNRIQIFESAKAIYITKRTPGYDFNLVLTCWNKESDTYFGPKGMFRNSALSNDEIYKRIAECKTKKGRKR